MTLMRWIIAVAALAALPLVSACSEPASDPQALRDEIESVLRENPDIVLDILAEHSEQVFEFAEAGLEAKQMRSRIESYQEDLLAPRQPEVEEDSPIRGDVDAPVTIVEYSDFQCPYCAHASRTVDRVLAQFAGEVRLVFKHTPLGSHPQAMIAAKYYEAAALQDPEKAWLLHDAMFMERDQLSARGEEFILEAAQAVGLDVDRLKQDVEGEEVAARIGRDMDEADRFGFTAAPTFLVGGVEIVGDAPFEEFAMVVQMVLDHQAQQAGAQGAAEGGEAQQ